MIFGVVLNKNYNFDSFKHQVERDTLNDIWPLLKETNIAWNNKYFNLEGDITSDFRKFS